MVFCGKPSKGCSNCRTRRIKCDQAKPACSQCQRANKECSGYRDQLHLMFRDESEKVVQKANVPKQAIESRKRPRMHQPIASSSEDPAHPLSPDPGSRKALTVQRSESPPSPTLHTEDEGLRFFYKNYVSPHVVDVGFKDFGGKPPLWRSPEFGDAVSSVGYAGLANVTKNKEYMIIARRKYARSLRQITDLLKDTSKTELDVIFKSIMVLAAFEVVNGSCPANGGYWGIHIDGAAAILKMIETNRPRGWNERQGHRMKMQFVFATYIKCLTRGEPSPPSMADWTGRCKETMYPADVTITTLADIVHRFVNLQASVLKGDPPPDPRSIYLEALDIDAELEDWNTKLPAFWRYRTVPSLEELEFVFEGQKHDYQDLWIARVHHNYRWARILVNELLLVHMARLDSVSPEEASSQQIQSLEVISTMATDICTGVSSQFYWNSPLETKGKNSPGISGCFQLLFPLAVAGSAMGVSDELHEWALKMLSHIGNEMGISQAVAMIPLVKMQRQSWQQGSNRYQVILEANLLITGMDHFSGINFQNPYQQYT